MFLHNLPLFLCSAKNRLLLAGSNCLATAASGLGVLTAHTQVPVVAETAVQTDLLHTLQILTHSSIQLVGHVLQEFAVLAVFLSVEEPHGNVKLTRVGDDGLDGLNFIFCELTGPFVSH